MRSWYLTWTSDTKYVVTPVTYTKVAISLRRDEQASIVASESLKSFQWNSVFFDI
jgi:hypothetical protein